MSLRGGLQPDEAILFYMEVASGEEQERPRNDIITWLRQKTPPHRSPLRGLILKS
jgi:hypothetical protein